MNEAERKLIRDMRTAAASHRRDGERLSADLLERGAQKIERLLEPRRVTGTHEYVDCPAGTGCPDCYVAHS